MEKFYETQFFYRKIFGDILFLQKCCWKYIFRAIFQRTNIGHVLFLQKIYWRHTFPIEMLMETYYFNIKIVGDIFVIQTSCRNHTFHTKMFLDKYFWYRKVLGDIIFLQDYFWRHSFLWNSCWKYFFPTISYRIILQTYVFNITNSGDILFIQKKQKVYSFLVEKLSETYFSYRKANEAILFYIKVMEQVSEKYSLYRKAVVYIIFIFKKCRRHTFSVQKILETFF